jgi:hypothetical protein
MIQIFDKEELLWILGITMLMGFQKQNTAVIVFIIMYTQLTERPMKYVTFGEEMDVTLDATERKRHHVIVGQMQVVGIKTNYIFSSLLSSYNHVAALFMPQYI